MKVIDMHCDTLSELMLAENRGEHLELRKNRLHVDLEKMQKGDYLLQNFALFIDLHRDGEPTAALLRMIDIYYNELEKNTGLIAPVLSASDIEKNAAAGRMSALLTMEEGAPCRGKVSFLRDFYRLGVRMMALTWNYENEIGWPNCVAKLPGYVPGQRYGLKEAGFEIVGEMQRLGMIVDVSHLSDDGFYDVCEVAKAPFVASHSNARALCAHPRNLTDDMLRKLAAHGGVAGLNFCSAFLTEESWESSTARMVEHIRYMTNVGGMDSVGLGTDYDGIQSRLEMDDCSKIQMLADEMSRQGFSEDQIEKIFYQNVLRVYREALK